MDRGPLALVVATLVLACGCAPQGSAGTASRASEYAVAYAKLPGLSSTPHAGLRAELAVLQNERMTPLALDADLVAASPGESDRQAPRRALAGSIPAISRPLLQAQLDPLYRGGPLHLSPVQRERGREVLRRANRHREQFQQALGTVSQRGLQLPPTEGPLADLQFLDAARLGCRLEAVAAALALAENQPDQALAPLGVMLQAAAVLATEPSVPTRLTAANLRADALHVLAAIAAHPRATRETHGQLLALLQQWTANWPPDAAAWIGDRAAGLIAYEVVRDGHYLSLLEPADLERLERQKLVSPTARAVLKNIDADELFYLQAMRQMIAAAHRPYFERAPLLAAIRADLATREQTGDYPLLAGQLLLADFETGHQRQAEDLVRVIAWRLALSAAIGQPAETELNPLTGQPLFVQVTALDVQVSGLALPEGNEPLVVPLRPLPQQARLPAGP